MQIRVIRELRLLLPDLDGAWPGLTDADPPDDLVGASIGDANWSRLRLEAKHVASSRFRSTNLSESLWNDVRVSGSEFEGADLSSARVTGCAVDRTRFTGCQISGLHISGTTLSNTLFENCRLDYATFDEVRTVGPVAFVNCTFNEGSMERCRLTNLVVVDCRLNNLELRASDFRGADLRGSRLDSVIGLESLRGAVITSEQTADLAIALVNDLNLRVIDSV